MQGTRSIQEDLPLPPPELMARVGQQTAADKELQGELSVADWYLGFGQRLKESIVELLPTGFRLEGKRVLDFGCGSGRVLRHFADDGAELFGCDLDLESIEWLQAHLSDAVEAFQNPPAPPLDLPDDSFDLIFSVSVFTHLTDDWSDWLLELHRLVRPDGYVIASFIGPEMASAMTGESLTENDLGMNSIGLARSFHRGSGPIVFHSHWWLEAHWGRAFEIVALKPYGMGRPHSRSQGAVLMRPKNVRLKREDLEWPVHGDVRELTSRRVNTRQLRSEAERERRRYVNEGRRKAEAQQRRAGGGPDGELLSPILVDCVGRGGSTLMMQLLGCSPQVLVEGPFPYERRYFAYFHHWSKLLEKDEWPRDLWGNPELAAGARWGDSIVGPPPWGPDELLNAPGAPVPKAMMRAAWQEFSNRAVASKAGPRPSFYAEKSVDTHRLDLGLLAGTQLLVLVRDPRDTFVSINAFNDKRERSAFGRGDLDDGQFLEAFIARHRRRMDWVSSLEAPLVIRYEDVVADPSQVANAISARLQIRFADADVQKVREPVKADHVTAGSVASSVGRWRLELDPAAEGRIRRELHDELRAFAYEV